MWKPKLGELTVTWTIGGDSGFGARRTRMWYASTDPASTPVGNGLGAGYRVISKKEKKREECGTTVKQKFGKEAVRCVHRRMKARLLGVWLRQGHGRRKSINMLLRGHASLVLSEGTLVVWHVDRAPHELLKGHQRTRLASVDANEDADGKCQGWIVRCTERYEDAEYSGSQWAGSAKHLWQRSGTWTWLPRDGPQPQARQVRQRACGQGHCMSCVWCARPLWADLETDQWWRYSHEHHAAKR